MSERRRTTASSVVGQDRLRVTPPWGGFPNRFRLSVDLRVR